MNLDYIQVEPKNISWKVTQILTFSLVMFYLTSCQDASVDIQGELKKWHTVSLNFEGPMTSEMDEYNPFLNYRLDVTFINGETTLVIPGFYAGAGGAAETGATSGNFWTVRFTPDNIGEWQYVVSFKKGENVAVAADVSTASSAKFMDGLTGSFIVSDTDKIGLDNRGKGRLAYIGESYLQFEETKEFFIKVGVDAPENLLAYSDFDATPNAQNLRKDWSPHVKDFDDEDSSFLWKGSKGQNLMGAINYLATEGMNAISFLTFNIDGDDRNVFPYLLNTTDDAYNKYASDKKNKHAWDSLFHRTRFDISKLDQWERIFSYAETKGMFLHFKTTETECDHLMDGGVFGTETKLYYRELIARFGHHLSLNWNLGEENNQPISEVIKVANYVYELDPYKHHLVLHTYPDQDNRYAGFIGQKSPLTGASMQLNEADFSDVHQRVLKWRYKSDSTGVKWALAVDEPGDALYALQPDTDNPDHDLARSNALWGTLMGGGYGVEWYFGYKLAHSDLTCQDFRSRDLFWNQNKVAHQFFTQNIPFWEMKPSDDLTVDDKSFCMSKEHDVYLIYSHSNHETVSLNLTNSDTRYSIRWYNPRIGGELANGSIESVTGGEIVSLGLPPSDLDKDWVILVKRDLK